MMAFLRIFSCKVEKILHSLLSKQTLIKIKEVTEVLTELGPELSINSKKINDNHKY